MILWFFVAPTTKWKEGYGYVKGSNYVDYWGICWLAMSFFPKDYEANILMVLIVGAVLGYQVGKKEKE